MQIYVSWMCACLHEMACINHVLWENIAYIEYINSIFKGNIIISICRMKLG